MARRLHPWRLKLYGKAVAPLETLYNGDSASLRLFLSKVQRRADQSGWTSILQISNQTGQVFDFIKNYGQVTIAAIRAQADALESANDRKTQNSSQMYIFLITSINNELLGKVISQTEQFTSNRGFHDGPSLLKVIVTISHVDTRAQAGYIRQCLARLSITILSAEYNCDIQKINEYVIILEEGLTARGETSQDTMMNVQAAYMVCKDADFVRHAKDEYARWDQGANITLKQYTTSCLTKYKTLKMKGMWEAPSPEQEQIIALMAAVSSLKYKAKSGKGKPTSNEASKTTEKGPRKNDGNFAWKDVALKANEPTMKVMNGKTYYWCTHHPNPMWALHNPTSFPDLCRLHPKYTEMEAAHKAKKQGATTDKDPMAADIKLSQAMAAIEDSGSEGSFEE
jgi:hypothetical protein